TGDRKMEQIWKPRHFSACVILALLGLLAWKTATGSDNTGPTLITPPSGQMATATPVLGCNRCAWEYRYIEGTAGEVEIAPPGTSGVLHTFIAVAGPSGGIVEVFNGPSSANDKIISLNICNY